jgi:hypothetical protein
MINTHRLANPVSEMLHLETSQSKPLPTRINMVIAEAKQWL